MGRSVSYANGSVAVCYNDVSDFEDSWEWDDFIEYIKESAKSAFPSLDDCAQWLGREDHAILENSHCFIGISEYCGLAAIWLVPKDSGDRPELAESWCAQVTPKFNKTFGELRKIGTFSNGESVFERIAA